MATTATAAPTTAQPSGDAFMGSLVGSLTPQQRAQYQAALSMPTNNRAQQIQADNALSAFYGTLTPQQQQAFDISGSPMKMVNGQPMHTAEAALTGADQGGFDKFMSTVVPIATSAMTAAAFGPALGLGGGAGTTASTGLAPAATDVGTTLGGEVGSGLSIAAPTTQAMLGTAAIPSIAAPTLGGALESGAFKGAVNAGLTGQNPLQGAVTGGLTSGIGYGVNVSGIGGGISSAVGGGTTGDVLGRAATGALTGGLTTGVAGGDPLKGAETGGISSGVASGLADSGVNSNIAGIMGSQVGSTLTKSGGTGSTFTPASTNPAIAGQDMATPYADTASTMNLGLPAGLSGPSTLTGGSAMTGSPLSTSSGLGDAGLATLPLISDGMTTNPATGMATSTDSGGSNVLGTLGTGLLNAVGSIPTSTAVGTALGLYEANQQKQQNAALGGQLTNQAAPVLASGQSDLAAYKNLSPTEQSALQAGVTGGTTAQTSANPLLGIGQQAMNQYGSGNLPAWQQQQLDQQVATAKANSLQALGPNADSSTMAQVMAQIDNQALQAKGQLLSQNLATGLDAYQKGTGLQQQATTDYTSAYNQATADINTNLQAALNEITTGLGPLSESITLQIQGNTALTGQLQALFAAIAKGSAGAGTGTAGAAGTLGNLAKTLTGGGGTASGASLPTGGGFTGATQYGGSGYTPTSTFGIDPTTGLPTGSSSALPDSSVLNSISPDFSTMPGQGNADYFSTPSYF